MDKLSIHQISIGNLLRSKREKDGVSQAAIAEKLNYRNYNYISMMETGRTNVPLKKIIEIIEAYGFDRKMTSVFMKKLKPDSWRIFLSIIRNENSPSYATDFDLKVSDRYETIIKEYGLEKFLEFE